MVAYLVAIENFVLNLKSKGLTVNIKEYIDLIEVNVENTKRFFHSWSVVCHYLEDILIGDIMKFDFFKKENILISVYAKNKDEAFSLCCSELKEKHYDEIYCKDELNNVYQFLLPPF